ncbi:MAG: glycogen/starch synthase [Bacteroidales bacterium]
MKDGLKKPDILVEVSWEVCNLVGGIYTVLSTKAKTLHEIFGDHLIFIGPDIWKGSENPHFIESGDVLKEWHVKASLEGLKVRTGRWNIPGNPIVILVDFEQYYSQRDQLYGKMWDWYGVDSLHAYGDYDEASMFAFASALVAESLYRFFEGKDKSFLVQFNEWTTGMGLLYLKKAIPAIAAVFTTHATSIGRSIAGNHKPLYDYLHAYNGDQMARELNMVSKHSVEKRAAMNADSFTTVSDITAREAQQLLEVRPLVTPNGFEANFVPFGDRYQLKRKQARSLLLTLAERLIGYTPSADVLLVSTAGRYEYKNKGLDVFLDSLDELRKKNPAKEVIAFILVPAWVSEPRHDLKKQMESITYTRHPLTDPLITHALHNYHEDAIMNRLNELHFKNCPADPVKVIFVPSYLQGNDGILNLSYYDILIGMDLTVFPSYYEPWGYTPLESIAFGIPTITTDLSGFGKWCESEGTGSTILSGVRVIKRNDSNAYDVAVHIADTIVEVTRLTTDQISHMRANAQELSRRADWAHFIDHYMVAYDKALRNVDKKLKDKK